MCVSARGEVVFALVKKRSGLLPAERRETKTRTVLCDFQLFGCVVAVDNARRERQAFERADAHVVAFDDGARV